MKKEPYFTSETIEAKAAEMLRDVEDLRKCPPLQPSRENCALLVLDMQLYFLDETSHAFIPSAPAILPGILKLIEVCKGNSVPIFFTRHQNMQADARMMAVWWKDLMVPESPYNSVIEEFQSIPHTVVKKSQYDAFFETELEQKLIDNNISQLLICGVMTHLCCETTARSAFVRGFEVFLAIDGTATYNEPFHRATLWNAAHGFAVPMLIEEIIAQLVN